MIVLTFNELFKNLFIGDVIYSMIRKMYLCYIMNGFKSELGFRWEYSRSWLVSQCMLNDAKIYGNIQIFKLESLLPIFIEGEKR